jgi:hypothetical protein
MASNVILRPQEKINVKDMHDLTVKDVSTLLKC